MYPRNLYAYNYELSIPYKRFVHDEEQEVNFLEDCISHGYDIISLETYESLKK
jgi:hypothetical protein